MKTPHINFSPKNGALLAYMSNKRAILAHYMIKISDHSCFRLSTSHV